LKAAIIYLVGFMGTGKTSVGRCLAEFLGWSFTDLDASIERREGIPIREIFRLKGEPYFRGIEREELRKLSFLRESVVALGGGAFCSDENIAIVKASGISVWLDLPLESLQDRCVSDGTRPLFTTPEETEALFRSRLPSYSKADLRLELKDLTVEDAARQILVLLGTAAEPRAGSPDLDRA
jgi:shikimate kinase